MDALDRFTDAMIAAAYGVTVKPTSWVAAFRLGHGTSMLDLDPTTGEWACFCVECLTARTTPLILDSGPFAEWSLVAWQSLPEQRCGCHGGILDCSHDLTDEERAARES